MVVTGVTAMQPLMSPDHLAACREPWIMTKVCTPPAHLLSAVCFVARPSAGFYTQTHQTWPGTESSASSRFLAGAGQAAQPLRTTPWPRPPFCWQARFASILPENPTWPRNGYS